MIDKKLENNFERTDTGHNFLNKPPIAQTLKSTISKWNLMKLRSFCKTKDTTKKKKMPKH